MVYFETENMKLLSCETFALRNFPSYAGSLLAVCSFGNSASKFKFVVTKLPTGASCLCPTSGMWLHNNI